MKIEKINELFARFAGQLLKMRWITLGIFALVIIVSVIGMKRMVKETSFDDYCQCLSGLPEPVVLDSSFPSSCSNSWCSLLFVGCVEVAAIRCSHAVCTGPRCRPVGDG